MKQVLFFIFIVFGLNSCSDFAKIQKSTDHNFKAEKAIEYYNDGKYDKAATLLEEVIPYLRLSPNFEDLYYKYSYCHYKLRDFYLANYYFKSFAKQFPQSKYAEDALFLAALCSVKNSPNFELDQAETQGAIDELQLFMNRYPDSPKKDTCNQIIDGLVEKLEKKAYENAYLYYRTENYKSAVIAFKGVLEKYPTSNRKNDLMLLIIKSGYRFAEMSVDEKKEERYRETMKNYSNFASLFTDEDKKKEAENYFKNCESGLEKLKATVKN